MAWATPINMAGIKAIHAQRFAPDGKALGAEFALSATSVHHQERPSLASLPDGGFVAVWQSMGQDGSDWSIVARRFDATGIPASAEFVINSTTTGVQIDPAVETLDNGDFIVTYSSATTAGQTLYSRVFSEAAEPLGQLQIAGNFNVGNSVAADMTGVTDVYGLGTLHYQWVRNGIEIPDAPSSSYDITQGDFGASLSLVVRWTSLAGYEEEVISTSHQIDAEDHSEITGNGDDETLTGTMDSDTIVAGGGRDTLEGLRGRDVLRGEAGQDKLLGGAGGDWLYGGGSPDRLIGSGGTDRLFGQDGDDRLTGGAGADRFLFRDDGSTDVITDFADGMDVIVLKGAGLDFDDVALSQDGTMVVIHFGTTTIKVRDAVVSDFSADDVI